MTKTTAAQKVAAWLAGVGISKRFAVTGGGAMFLDQAFAAAEGIETVYCHHEQACAMAAEGVAQATGTPAIVSTTTGPGAINALNGVFGAYTDSMPAIVISGQVKSTTCVSFYDGLALRQLGDQEGPTVALAKNVTKFAAMPKTAADLGHMIPKAYALAVSGRKGPVWIDIPMDIQSSEDEFSFDDHRQHLEVSPLVAADDVAFCAALLASAKKPVIIAGTGVFLSGAKEQLQKCAERWNVPVCTAWRHDVFDDAHPLWAGRPGSIGTRPGNFTVQNADFVLVVGSRLNIRQTGYSFDSFAKNATVVQVDIDPLELDKPTFKPDRGVVADAKAFLSALASHAGAFERGTAWTDWISKLQHDFPCPADHHKQAKDGMLNPYLAIAKIIEKSPNDAVFVGSNASACIIPFQTARLGRKRTLFSNSGCASMGYGLPAAIGAFTGTKRKTVCFEGDGSIMMNLQELQTAKTINANIAIVIIDNDGYLSIKQTQDNFFGKRVGTDPRSGVSFPDFGKLAGAFGIPFKKASSDQELDDAIEFANKANGPVVIHLIADPAQEFQPRIRSRRDETGKIVSPELDDMYPFLEPETLAKIRRGSNGQ